MWCKIKWQEPFSWSVRNSLESRAFHIFFRYIARSIRYAMPTIPRRHSDDCERRNMFLFEMLLIYSSCCAYFISFFHSHRSSCVVLPAFRLLSAANDCLLDCFIFQLSHYNCSLCNKWILHFLLSHLIFFLSHFIDGYDGKNDHRQKVQWKCAASQGFSLEACILLSAKKMR